MRPFSCVLTSAYNCIITHHPAQPAALAIPTVLLLIPLSYLQHPVLSDATENRLVDSVATTRSCSGGEPPDRMEINGRQYPGHQPHRPDHNHSRYDRSSHLQKVIVDAINTGFTPCSTDLRRSADR